MKQLSKWWQNLRSYLDSEKKELIPALITFLLVILAFLAYLKFVGLPMTRARNRYNEGMLLLATGAKKEAHQKFDESLSYWDTSEAREMFQITTDNN